MQEVYPGIFMITQKGKWGMTPPVNIYVITGPNGLIFDAGYGRRDAVNQVVREFNEIKKICEERKKPFGISRIIPSHSHADHFSGLSKLRKKLGLTVITTGEMAQRISSEKNYNNSYNRPDDSDFFKKKRIRRIILAPLRFIESFNFKILFGVDYLKRADLLIDENSEININGRMWQIIHTPGHARDHISLYDPLNGILFAGDNILRSITTWLGPPESDLEVYKNTLENTLELPGLKLILSAHGSPVTEPHDRIREILEWRQKRLEHVLEVISAEGNSGIRLPNILKKLYPSTQPVKARISEGWVTLSVQYLLNKGEIMAETRRGKVFFVRKEKTN